MSPRQPKQPSSEVTRLEQRSSSQPIPAANGAAQPVPYMANNPVPYMANNQAVNTVGEAQAQPQPQQAQAQPSQQPQSPQAQPQQVPQPAQPQVQEASTKPVEPKPQTEQKPKPQPEQKSPAQATVAAPEDSFAKARDADLRRDDRRAEDKRKWERRKWSDKRKWRQRDDDLADVEASVREDSERRTGRDAFSGRDERRFDRGEPRPMFSSEPRFGRGFSLFDSD